MEWTGVEEGTDGLLRKGRGTALRKIIEKVHE